MGVASEDQKEALTKFLKSNERWNKMALRFSAIKRRQDAIGGYFDAKIGKNLRKSFASFLLKNRAFSNASWIIFLRKFKKMKKSLIKTLKIKNIRKVFQCPRKIKKK